MQFFEKAKRIHKRIANRSYIERKIRTLFRQPTIHVFGDSHTELFDHPLFTVHYVGPATAYNLNNPSSTVQAKQKIYKLLREREKSTTSLKVLLVFGEIDCRIHIYNTHNKKHVSIASVVHHTVEKYGEFILDLKRSFPTALVSVLNVLPQGVEGNVYTYPFYADRSTRLKITREFNKSLEKFCIQNGVMYISVFDELLDKNDRRKKDYISDNVHYNKKTLRYIIPLLKEKGYYYE